MGIYIKGMEMPTSCAECLNVGLWNVFECHLDDVEQGKRPDCPLIEIPDKHGRLIDADALMDALTRAKEDDPLQYEDDYFAVSDWLCVAPTVIDAELCNDLAKPNNDAEEGE